MDREYPFIPTDRERTFNVVAGADHFDACLYLDWGTDRPDALPLAAQFPKSHRVKASSLSSPAGRCGTVRITVDLSPNANKGAANETGEARIRNFVRIARKLGYRFEVQVRKINEYVNGTPISPPADVQIARAERFLGDHASGGGFIAYHGEGV